MNRRKRWARRGRLPSLFGCHTTLNLSVPSSMPRAEKEKDRRMGNGAKKVDSEQMGKAGTSGTVSHCLTMVS